MAFNFKQAKTIDLVVPVVVTSGEGVSLTNDVVIDTYRTVGVGFTSLIRKDEYRTYADVKVGDLFLYTRFVIELDSVVRILGQQYEVKSFDTSFFKRETLYRYLVRIKH